MRNVLDILEEMVETPTEYVVRTDEEVTKIGEDATWLIDQLRPFAEDGRYENLGRETEFDIRDEKVIYLDLAQQEESLGGSTSLIMVVHGRDGWPKVEPGVSEIPVFESPLSGASRLNARVS